MNESLAYAISLGKLSGKNVIYYPTCQHSQSPFSCENQLEIVIALEDEETFYIMMPCEAHLSRYLNSTNPEFRWEIIK